MKTVKRKPHWPKWAKYKATDINGAVFIYDNEPEINRWHKWWVDMLGGNAMGLKTKKNYKGNWKKSLRKIED